MFTAHPVIFTVHSPYIDYIFIVKSQYIALGADEGYRTMLDALMPAARAFEQGQTLAEAAVSAVHGAHYG